MADNNNTNTTTNILANNGIPPPADNSLYALRRSLEPQSQTTPFGQSPFGQSPPIGGGTAAYTNSALGIETHRKPSTLAPQVLVGGSSLGGTAAASTIPASSGIAGNGSFGGHPLSSTAPPTNPLFTTSVAPQMAASVPKFSTTMTSNTSVTGSKGPTLNRGFSSLDNILAAASYHGHLTHSANSVAAHAAAANSSTTAAPTPTSTTGPASFTNALGGGSGHHQVSGLASYGSPNPLSAGVPTSVGPATTGSLVSLGGVPSVAAAQLTSGSMLGGGGGGGNNTVGNLFSSQTHDGLSSGATTVMAQPGIHGSSNSTRPLLSSSHTAIRHTNTYDLLSGSHTINNTSTSTAAPSPISLAGVSSTSARAPLAVSPPNHTSATVGGSSAPKSILKPSNSTATTGATTAAGSTSAAAQQQQVSAEAETQAEKGRQQALQFQQEGKHGAAAGGQTSTMNTMTGADGASNREIILQKLPSSPLLYVLVTSEGRDKSFKLMQYLIKLMISVLNLKGIIPAQMESASAYWSVRLAQNVQTVRNGRSMFKLGRWLVTCLHLQTAIERLQARTVHDEAIAQLEEEHLFQKQREEEGEDAELDFGLAIAAEAETAAAAGLTHQPIAHLHPLHSAHTAHMHNNNTNHNGGMGGAAHIGTPTTPSIRLNTGHHSRTSSPCASVSGRSPAMGPAIGSSASGADGGELPDASSSVNLNKSQRTTYWPPEMPPGESPPRRRTSLPNSAGVSASGTPATTPKASASAGTPSHRRFAATTIDPPSPTQRSAANATPTAASSEGIISAGIQGVPDHHPVTPHISPAAAAAAAALAAIQSQDPNPHNLHPTCHAGGRVVRFSNSYQLAVFQPAEDAQCKNWRKSIVDFPRWGMYLLIIRCVTSVIRNLFRDCLYMGEKALFGFSRSKSPEEIKALWNTVTLGRRTSLQIVADMSWLVMSTIDLLLNTKRLLQRSWIACALNWDTDYYCQCNLQIDNDDGEVIWAHVDPTFIRNMDEVSYPSLDLDFGSVTPTSSKFFEAANPATMKLCCTRCGCLLQKVPISDEVPKELRPNPLQNNHNHSNAYDTTMPLLRQDGSVNISKDTRQVMAFPYFVRKCLNVLSCAKNNENLKNTLWLQLRYMCDVFLAYGFVFGDHFTKLPESKKYLQHVNMWQALAGIASSYVALQRVLQSAK